MIKRFKGSLDEHILSTLERSNESFEQHVERSMLQNTNKEIYCSNWFHDICVFKELLREARRRKTKNLKIVSGQLYGKFFNELNDEFELCLQEGVLPKIIVLHPLFNIEQSKLASRIKKHILEDETSSHSGTKLEDHLIKPPPNMSVDIRHPHFVLLDNDCYRLELSHSKTTAIANFHDYVIGKFLHKTFDDLSAYLKAKSREQQ
jgi:hypothetical protein